MVPVAAVVLMLPCMAPSLITGALPLNSTEYRPVGLTMIALHAYIMVNIVLDKHAPVLPVFNPVCRA